MDQLLPRALVAGDEIAVVAPASGVRDIEALERGLERFRNWGLEPVLLPHARAQLDWPEGCPIAASDADRLADLQCAIDDPRYRAIVSVRGGYGTTRLLDGLVLDRLREDPKPILGYSDLTALLAALHGTLGLVGFHGPMLATSSAMDAGDALWPLQRQLLMSPTEPAQLPVADAATGVVGGAAEGVLVGGNLSLVQSLIGTPWEIATTGALLFLEDIGEPPYRVDRMLTHLRQTGAFDRAAGVILGDFHVEGTELASEHGPMTAVLEERLGDLAVPVARGVPFGHRPGSWTLPVGVRARLRVPAVGGGVTLQLLEPAVRA
ncbi:MAG: LD-carboxypeptidase [bacterium]|nr:LD-carboxypeptidase [bacterium]